MAYIKIDRKILEWGWYKDTNTAMLFIHLLLRANWKDAEFQGVSIKRGSLATSYNALSWETGMSVHKVRVAMKHLLMTGEVTSKAYSKFTVITVKNYDAYQQGDKVDDKQVTQKWHARAQTDDTEVARNPYTIEEYKNKKNIRKKERKNPYAPLEFNEKPDYEEEEVGNPYPDDYWDN